LAYEVRDVVLCVVCVVVIPSHFQQAFIAICPIHRTDNCPHDRTLPFDQRGHAAWQFVSGWLRLPPKVASSSARMVSSRLAAVACIAGCGSFYLPQGARTRPSGLSSRRQLSAGRSRACGRRQSVFRRGPAAV